MKRPKFQFFTTVATVNGKIFIIEQVFWSRLEECFFYASENGIVCYPEYNLSEVVPTNVGMAS